MSQRVSQDHVPQKKLKHSNSIMHTTSRTNVVSLWALTREYQESNVLPISYSNKDMYALKYLIKCQNNVSLKY